MYGGALCRAGGYILYYNICICVYPYHRKFRKKKYNKDGLCPFFLPKRQSNGANVFYALQFVVFFGVKAANTGIIKAGSGDGFHRRNGLRECCSLTASIGGTCLALTVVLYGFSVFCPLFSRVCSRRFRGVSRSVASPCPLLRRPRDRCFFQRTFRGSFGPRSTPS